MYFIILVAIAVVSCNAEAPEAVRSPMCTKRNNYYQVDNSCDSYVECRDYVAREMMCPDGLHYNPKAEWPAYPCGYPTDITCAGRGLPQPAMPTADCPHQYGFYPSPSATTNDCGMYRMCVEGRSIDMMCPPGLAFNNENARCDWPDMVTSCDAKAFLGFQCPEVPVGANGEIPVINYRYEGNCYAFFSCEAGRARLLTCDAGLAFDSVSGKCIDADLVQCAMEKLY